MGMSVGAARFGTPIWASTKDNQSDSHPGWTNFSPAIDEWIVRDGIVSYSVSTTLASIGAGGARSLNPRIGIQYDANARTRLKAAYAPGGEEGNIQNVIAFEDTQVAFREAGKRPIAFVDGRAVMDRSHRLEFGIERVIDIIQPRGRCFPRYDVRTWGRLAQHTDDRFLRCDWRNFINVANQQGASKGMRLVYTRRLSRMWTASAGYSFGRGQRLASGDISQPTEIFESGFFQTAALQLGAGLTRHKYSHRVALLAKRYRVCYRSFCRTPRCL